MAGMTGTVLGTALAGVHRLTVQAFEQDDPTSPVVVLVPAMGVPARYYEPLIRCLHEVGHTVISFDVRGQGQSSPRATRQVRFGYRELIDDLDAVLDLLDSVYPKAPRFLIGHSLGGHLALLHAATRPTRVQGVALLASGSVWFRSFRGGQVLRTLIGSQLIAAVSTLLGYWPGHRFGFGGRQPARVMRDWARQCRTGRFELAGSSIDFEAALRALRLPVLAVSIEDDELAPVPAVDHLSGKARQSVRTRRHYTRASAGADKLGHFAWVRNGSSLSGWISEWITAHSGAGSAVTKG